MIIDASIKMKIVELLQQKDMKRYSYYSYCHNIPDIFISSVTIGNSAGSQGTSVIVLGEAEKLVINPEDITVNIAS